MGTPLPLKASKGLCGRHRAFGGPSAGGKLENIPGRAHDQPCRLGVGAGRLDLPFHGLRGGCHMWYYSCHRSLCAFTSFRQSIFAPISIAPSWPNLSIALSFALRPAKLDPFHASLPPFPSHPLALPLLLPHLLFLAVADSDFYWQSVCRPGDRPRGGSPEAVDTLSVRPHFLKDPLSLEQELGLEL